MRFLRPLVIAVAVTGLGYLIFEWTRPSYPVSRIIQNSQGKTLDVLIQGRDGRTIIFDRMPSRDRFEIDIDSLSLADKFFCLRLKSLPAPEKKKIEAGYVERRRRMIAELKVKETVIMDELSSQT